MSLSAKKVILLYSIFFCSFPVCAGHYQQTPGKRAAPHIPTQPALEGEVYCIHDDLYAILGLTPQATTDEIARSFRILAKIYHADKENNAGEQNWHDYRSGTGIHAREKKEFIKKIMQGQPFPKSPEFSKEYYAKIRQAYDTLSDSQKRFVYDHPTLFIMQQLGAQIESQIEKQTAFRVGRICGKKLGATIVSTGLPGTSSKNLTILHNILVQVTKISTKTQEEGVPKHHTAAYESSLLKLAQHTTQTFRTLYEGSYDTSTKTLILQMKFSIWYYLLGLKKHCSPTVRKTLEQEYHTLESLTTQFCHTAQMQELASS